VMYCTAFCKGIKDPLPFLTIVNQYRVFIL
jgi:hypothetical protein